MNLPSEPASTAVPAAPAANLPLRKRPIDIFFICLFGIFTITCVISDAVPTLGIAQTPDAAFVPAQWNYMYSSVNDPLFLHPPFWMRISTGLSALVYGPFYILLIVALARGWNRIQLPAVIYATMIITVTGIIIFGVEFFGEAEFRTPHPVVFLLFNGPYVLGPLLLLIRMRRERPFQRKF